MNKKSQHKQDAASEVEISGALEDYLESIYLLVRDNKVARVKDIAKARRVRPVSVTQAMHRLAELGLIDYAQRERIELTPEGERLAQRVFSRHRALTRFFGEILGVEAVKAESTACAMEHQLGDEAMDALVRFFEFLQVCPEGRSFLHNFHRCSRVHPDQPPCEHYVDDGHGACQGWDDAAHSAVRSVADGPDAVNGAGPVKAGKTMAAQDKPSVLHAMQRVEHKPHQGQGAGRGMGLGLGLRRRGHENRAVNLADLPPGQKARITQIHGRGAVRQRLLDMGLLPNEWVEVERLAPGHGPVWIKLNGYQLALRRQEARVIDVEISQD